MTEKLGATGKFPDGKIDESDQGELCIGIAFDEKSGNVIVNFGKPVWWFAMPPEQIIAFAHTLIHHAEQANDVRPPTPLC